MEVFGLDQRQFGAFLLVLVRTSGIFGFAPIFSNPRMPMQVRVGLCFFLAVLIAPLVDTESYQVGEKLLAYAIDVIGELLIGLAIGFVVALIMTGVQLAGNLIDFQTGFGMANVVDPLSSVQVTVMGQFKILLATLVFVVVRGDHIIISALVDSFRMVPLASVGYSEGAALQVFSTLSSVFALAFRICAPVVAVLFLSTIGLGIVARTVPQMNILIVGFPLKIGVGLVATMASIPFIVAIVRRAFTGSGGDVRALLRFMGG